MRILILFLIAAFCSSAQASPGGQVFNYECNQIDPQVTHFECRFDKDGFRITWKLMPLELPQPEQERVKYEFNKIALRYFQLGGKQLVVKLPGWPKEKERHCSRLRNKPFYKFSCMDCVWEKLNDGRQCKQL